MKGRGIADKPWGMDGAEISAPSAILKTRINQPDRWT